MVTYDEALRIWGAAKLREDAESRYQSMASWEYAAFNGSLEDSAWMLDFEADTSAVKVEFYFNEGFACCGGADPECYCSFAESPTAHVEISGSDSSGHFHRVLIDASDFDFATVLKEIVTAAGGVISS